AGDVAQLGEHLLCKQGVVGSIPIVSTRWVFRQVVVSAGRCSCWCRRGLSETRPLTADPCIAARFFGSVCRCVPGRCLGRIGVPLRILMWFLLKLSSGFVLFFV